MPRLIFTSHLDGIAPEGEPEFPGATAGEVLTAAFAAYPGLKHYIVDDQGRLRKHVIIFVDGKKVGAENFFETAVGKTSEIYVLQALSGG